MLFKDDAVARAEAKAVRENAGWYRWTHDLVTVTGADAEKFLDWMLVNTIAGTPEGIAEVSDIFAGMKARVIPLNVAGAFHSKLMQPAADKFYETAKTIEFKAPNVKYYSNLTGGELTDFSDMASMLAKHIVSPVRFTSELAAMQEAGADKFVEFGPGRTLTGLVKKTLKDVTAVNVEDMETLEGALS